jgi:hypothetical protein
MENQAEPDPQGGYYRARLFTHLPGVAMKLSVTEIRFLSSGAVSVEVGASSTMDRPTTTSVDAVRFQVYIPKGEVQNDLDALKAAALKAVNGFKME